ncbi:phosphate metabolism protein 7 [Coniosporium apollinis]|uniref:Phosphate metabolism protein 7 n=1 Tax=Coniosporium apollinis TaxID=61459 RepID=A0ABQ9P593_9PEZI|nr:phosphate metabolism protein 7 [Coniosporium apollinis]
MDLSKRQNVADPNNDPNVGAAQDPSKNSNSASTVLSTLAPVALIALIWFILFLILRRKFPQKYSPRTFLGTLRGAERTPSLPNGFLSWFPAFFKIPDTYVLNHHSLDGYLFLRLLKLSVISCFVGCLITWPVLFPVNITGGGGQQQLDMLSFSNVANNYYRYYAHAGCAWLFFGFIILMITRESIFYINLRQAYLMSPLYAHRMSSRTVLFTSVPQDYLNEAKLRAVLGEHVLRVWIPTDVSELEDMVEDRDKAAMKLEAAETKLIRLANGARLKSMKKSGAGHEESNAGLVDDEAESGSAAARWIQPKQRPTHRLKPIIGKKVDTINWARSELQHLIPEVEKEQNRHRSLDGTKLINSVFVEFDSLSEAQAAYQSLTHHQVLHMAPRYTGINPEEVIWSNLRIKWWERIIRVTATTAFVVVLIIFWSVPVAVVGAISNITYLTEQLPWLGFINDIPPAFRGVITGLLPVILLAALMALLPIILRLMARLGGDPTRSAVELTVQNTYFAFQVVQVFLVATIGSAASSAIQEIIQNPVSVTNLLSTQLPKASNFYLAYFILQGLGVVASILVGLAGLVIALILSKILDKTPRKLFRRWTRLYAPGWGTVFPVYTNLFIIAICYSCIAPLVLFFAGLGLWFFYFAYRYNLLYVYDVNVDTKGLVYPRALKQLFVGLYLAELCLIGLFAIKLGENGAIGPFVLMIVFLIFTALYHISLNAALKPLLQYLPKSLEAEERSLLSAENGKGTADGREKHGMHHAEGNAAPHKKPGLLAKFLRPDKYNDYRTMRRLVPRDFADINYEPEVARDAYLHPAITSTPPLLWIPRDPAGVSRQEVRDTGKVIAITDVGAHLDEKNKIVWDDPNISAPIHEEKVYY